MVSPKAQNTTKIILFAICLCLLRTDAYALFINGIEVPAKGSSSDCYIYNKYIVAVKSSGFIGDIISVRKRASENDFSCNMLSQKSKIFTIDGSDSTETFIGIYKHFLFTDSGTGPDGRGIWIYDLRKKKDVYYSYSGNQMKIQNNALFFDKDIEPQIKVECPGAEKWESEGFSTGFEQYTQVDLDSFHEVSIGEISCSQRQ